MGALTAISLSLSFASTHLCDWLTHMNYLYTTPAAFPRMLHAVCVRVCIVYRYERVEVKVRAHACGTI